MDSRKACGINMVQEECETQNQEVFNITITGNREMSLVKSGLLRWG